MDFKIRLMWSKWFVFFGKCLLTKRCSENFGIIERKSGNVEGDENTTLWSGLRRENHEENLSQFSTILSLPLHLSLLSFSDLMFILIPYSLCIPLSLSRSFPLSLSRSFPRSLPLFLPLSLSLFSLSLSLSPSLSFSLSLIWCLFFFLTVSVFLSLSAPLPLSLSLFIWLFACPLNSLSSFFPSSFLLFISICFSLSLFSLPHSHFLPFSLLLAFLHPKHTPWNLC